MKKLIEYLRLRRSRVVHRSDVAYQCFYFCRSMYPSNQTTTATKPRGCSVCDECQRLAKLKK